MLAAVFRMLGVVIFAVHIFFVISGEAAVECEEVQGWTAESPVAWFQEITSRNLSGCVGKGCQPVHRDGGYNTLGLDRVEGFYLPCRQCLLIGVKEAVRGKYPHLKTCEVHRGPERFAEPNIAPPKSKRVVPPSVSPPAKKQEEAPREKSMNDGVS